MNPNHCPNSALLMAYASGSLTEAFSLVVASHLSFCKDCQQKINDAEMKTDTETVLFNEKGDMSLKDYSTSYSCDVVDCSNNKKTVDLFFKFSPLLDPVKYAIGKYTKDDEEVKKLILHNNSTVSLSDAGAHLSLLCDAGYGLDLLGKWSRDLNIMSLEKAIYEISGKQADIFRIPKRGKLLQGYYADMLLFDPDKIGTSKSFRINDLPAGSSRLKVKPLGIKGIWVNGTNYLQKETPNGRLIRSYLP